MIPQLCCDTPKSSLPHVGMQYLSFNMKQKFPEETILFFVAPICGSSLSPGLPRACKVKAESNLWATSRSPPSKCTKELLKRSLVTLLVKCFSCNDNVEKHRLTWGWEGGEGRTYSLSLTLSTLNFIFYMGPGFLDAKEPPPPFSQATLLPIPELQAVTSSSLPSVFS